MDEINSEKNNIQFHNLLCVELQNYSPNKINEKNFMRGLQNAKHILSSLERSIDKARSYEDKLLQCKATHHHWHEFNDLSWDTEFSDDLKSPYKSSGLENQLNLVESWSTMSIVCLQYQYEELSKRYESLLKAFNDQCSDISIKNCTLSRLKKRVKILHAQLMATHNALLCIGDKYLALKKRRVEQEQKHLKVIELLKCRVRDVLASAERDRLHLNNKLLQSMALEPHSEYAMLLNEMKKCNKLFLENLKLKAELEDLVPGSVKWD